VIQHVGLGIQDDAQRLFQALEIRNEYFDAAVRRQLADRVNGLSEDAGAANVVIVAINAGHDRVLEPQRGHGFSYAARLFPIDGFGTSLGNGAKTAAPSTDISQQHESRGLMIPALANVRALCRFANRVKAQASRQLLQIVEIVSHGSFRPQP
jgi:hypothetical protein